MEKLSVGPTTSTSEHTMTDERKELFDHIQEYFEIHFIWNNTNVIFDKLDKLEKEDLSVYSRTGAQQ